MIQDFFKILLIRIKKEPIDLLDKHSNLWSKFYLPLYAIPFLITFLFVDRFGVDVPVFDALVLTDLFHEIDFGTADFLDFWRLHNEHRFVIPRFAIATLAFLTDWNTKTQQYASVMLAIAIGISLYWIARKKNGDRVSPLTDIAIAIALGSLVQYENWLWGFQIAWFWINLCFVLAIALLSHENLQHWRDRHFGLAALFCGLASFSCAHGLLTWLAVLPCVWVKSRHAQKPRRWLLVWCSGFVATVLLYFIDYHKPAHAVDPSHVLKHPREGLEFFFALVGHPFSSASSAAIAWGIALSLASLGCFWLFWRDRANRKAIAPWISLMLFSLGFAAMTTVGRSSLGLTTALASRYTTVSLLLFVGLLYTGQYYAEIATRPWQGKVRFGYRAIVACVAVMLAVTSLSVWELGKDFRNHRLFLRTCLSLVGYMEDDAESSCVRRLYPDVNIVKHWWSPRLDRLGFFERSHAVEFRDRPQPSCGYLDRSQSSQVVELSDRGTAIVSGRVRFENCQTVLPIVFLSRNDSTEMFASDLIGDFVDSSREPETWTVQFVSRDLQPGRHSLRAWVYDPERSAFLSLYNSLDLRVVD
ncbi:putative TRANSMEMBRANE PROTEIN [Geitlerinema sp. FC II]|nr:putative TRANSMEMBRANE PROTEIN [Geitlerinema sp. FC II]